MTSGWLLGNKKYWFLSPHGIAPQGKYALGRCPSCFGNHYSLGRAQRDNTVTLNGNTDGPDYPTQSLKYHTIKFKKLKLNNPNHKQLTLYKHIT